MINKKNIFQKSTKGFTLIEVLVAVFILITAVVVPLTISSKGIFYSNVVRDQSVASYLAQEAMEYIRLQRDNIFLDASANNQNADSAWGAFTTLMSPCVGDSIGCTVDTLINRIRECEIECELSISEGGRYNHQDDGVKSDFRRMVQITQRINPSRMQVDVIVSWKTNTLERSITVTNYLMPWQL